MDIRLFLQDFLLVMLFINIHPGLSYIEDDYEDGASFGRCPWIRNKLKNGRVRYRYKGRVAKFLCDSGYDLAGKRSSTCVRGQWSNPVPVCVARGCSRVPMISNGHVTEMYRGALLVYDCNPGYTLDGVASIHCDGRRWSTSPPDCVVATENPEMTCDFENPDLCGWSHDPNHDFDWKRNQFATPSGHAGTGPSFDHTFGENKGGYYLYIEASSPRKINDTARLFSPVYSGALSGGCFLFWYHMYGATTGGLKVYLKPESHVFDELLPKWEKFGDQGNQWNRGIISIPVFHENFQIVIEGIRGESYVGDSAIDDVSLTTQDCDTMVNDTSTVENTNAESCRGRCRESGAEESSSCGCTDNCYSEHNCCSDYATFCFEGNETTVHNTEETPGESLLKTSPISSTDTVASKISEQYASNTPPKSASISSTGTIETVTSPMTTIISPVWDSSLSSSTSSKVPLDITTMSATVSTSTSLPNRTVQITSTSSSAATAKPSPTPRSSPKPIVSSTTSVATTKSPTTSERMTTSPTIRTTNSSTVRTTTSSTARATTSSTARTTTSSTARATTSSTARTTTSSTARTTTSSTARTTMSSTARATTSSKAPVQTTVVFITPRKTTELTTFPTPVPTTSPTTEPATAPTTQPSASPTTNFTTLAPTSRFTTSSETTLISSTLPNTTVIVQSTSASPIPASPVTTEPSTRKTYNLRPRTQKPTPISSVTYANTKTESFTRRVTDISVLRRTTSVAQSTRLNDDIATISFETSSTTGRVPIYVQSTTWHSFPVTPYYEVTGTRIQYSTKLSTTKATVTSRPHTRQTTGQYTPQIFKFTSTQTPPPHLVTSESYDAGTSEAKPTASSSKMPLVISLLFVILIIAAGVVYYMRRKRKSKRQSKLSDDSEMRFLQENEYMEYSDASALDRILVK